MSEPNEVNILPFKKGPFHLALALEYDIVIVILVGGSRLWKADQLLPRPGTLYLKIVDRIRFEDVAHMDHNELRIFIEKKMHENYVYKTDEEVLNRRYPSAHYVLIWLVVHFLILKWIFF